MWMTTPPDPSNEVKSSSASALRQEVTDRFGLLPNFFCLTPEAPEITANLWGFARFGYLDNPLPPLFKERLFVYLSRFCDVRYCIARHVGFLVGLGRPAGDRACPPETIEQAVRLIQRPLPQGEALEPHLARLETCDVSFASLPESGTELEESLFACATHVFLQTPQMSRCLKALGVVLDRVTFEHLMVYLAFVRTAHYWTKLHRELGFEDDIKRLLAIHQELADCVLNDPESASSETAQILRDELSALRRDSSEALRASENRVRAVFGQAAVGILIADLSGRLLEINPRLCQMLERNCEGLYVMTCEDLTHPDDRSRSKALMQEVAEGKRSEFTVETRYLRNNGTWIWVNMAVTPLRDAGGRVEQLLGVIEDIHARKTAEEALREADRRKDEFLATLAHELRNPLAPIRNSLDILRLAGSDSGAAERLHETIERQVNQMVRLVDDLMEVSRITRGKIEIRRELIEVAAVVRSAVETSKPLIDEAGHQLAISLPAEPLMLDADPVRISQVLANLLNNAAKYTPNGGQIWLTVRSEGSTVALSVRDAGAGIATEMLSKVFDLFAQADRTYDRAQGGLGIGLTLVRSLVDMHGGSVEAKSDGLGHGSEFIVRLPLAVGRPAVQEQRRTDILCESVAGRRVLVVDDSSDAADSLKMLLQLLGADVQSSTDGVAALEALDSYRPAIVLLDIGMPGMDGYEVARRMRQRSIGQEATLIALTGWGQEEDRRKSKEAGFDHHLVKPVDLGALQALLASLQRPRPRPARVSAPLSD
jgi:PAS domain S-box-containing protein